MGTEVLVVDNTISTGELLRTILLRNRLASRVELFSEGNTARQWLQSLIERISETPRAPLRLILIEPKLPAFAALEFCKWIKENDRLKVVPIVVFSGLLRPEEAVEFFQAGANSCVMKPKDASEFEEAVCRIGRYWLQYSVLP